MPQNYLFKALAKKIKIKLKSATIFNKLKMKIFQFLIKTMILALQSIQIILAKFAEISEV